MFIKTVGGKEDGLRLFEDQLSFADVVELESQHAGLYYKRVDYKAAWWLRFNPDKAGRLTIGHVGHTIEQPLEIYHHDFMDGDWQAFTDCSLKEHFKKPE